MQIEHSWEDGREFFHGLISLPIRTKKEEDGLMDRVREAQEMECFSEVEEATGDISA
jgi:hypothetical protein